VKGKYYKPNILQDLTNAYPGWSSVRNDLQSVGAQVLNCLAQPLEDLRSTLRRELDNNWLQSFDNNGVGQISEVDIDSITLNYNDDFPGENILFSPPMSGLQDGTWYPVSLADPNSLETLFYETLPTRVSQTEVSTIGLWHTLLNSGIFINSAGVYSAPPWPDMDVELPYPNQINVEIQSGQQFYTNALKRQCIAKLDGRDRHGIKISEEIPFLFNDTISTTRTFSELNSASLVDLNITDTDAQATFPAKIKITSGKFAGERPLLDPNQLTFSVERTRGIRKWDLFYSAGLGGSILQQMDYNVVEDDVFRSNSAVLETTRETLLRDTSSTVITAGDMTIMPNRPFFFVVGSGVNENQLYGYDFRDLHWPAMGELNKKNYDSFGKIHTNKDILAPGDTLTIDCILERKEVEPLKSRLIHITPAGAWTLVQNKTEVAFIEDTWDMRGQQVIWDPSGSVLLPTYSTVLTEAGDHIWTLEIAYGDGTIDTDQRVITVDTLDASVEFDISTLVDLVALGADFDVDGNLWILDSTDKYFRLQLHNDRAVINADSKVAYFYENYDEVTIE